jgi:uncharacterized protein (TIGR02271 family)
MNRHALPIELGAVVEARDGRLGTIDEIVLRPGSGELAYLLVRRGWSDELLMVAADLIEALPSRREVRLAVTRDEARARAADVAPEMIVTSERGGGGEVRVPLVEERLVPATRPVDLGELRVHRTVEYVDETLRQAVTRDDLTVEHVPINRPLEQPVAARYEGDCLVIPIMEEVLVVRKQLMLVEEVRIAKRQVTEEQEVHEVVRRGRVQFEDATVHGVHGLHDPNDVVTRRLDAIQEREVR